MPLSPAVPREHLHTRAVHCLGFRRTDGLWDIEGHMVDTKTYGFDNQWRGHVEPGVPVHQMWIRLTLDDHRTITAIEAATDHSPFEICAAAAPKFQRLVGLRIGPGFTAKVRELLGGTEGCTHLVELLGPMATTAYQTMTAWDRKKPRETVAPKRRPMFIDSCHALAADGEVVKRQWPEYYTGPR